MEIKTLNQNGVYLKDIAAEIGVHPRTVRRALERGGAPKRTVARRASKLDPYKARVDELLGQNVWNVVVIWREIQKLGYTGGVTRLRMYVQPKRVLRPSPATVRYETEPGRQLQSDWGEVETEVAGQRVKVHFIVNELGYSRRFHYWCTDREDAEHTYEGLIRSFEYFSGVPQEVLVDNQKSAVLQASNAGQPKFNERFVDLAGHYGFTPRACRPYRARTKGKDERMVRYIKENFFARYRVFESWAHLNQLAEAWLKEEADQRLQNTVKEVVAERFQRELPLLQPLPPIRYDTSYLDYRKAAWDGYIDVRGNRYSVPAALAGQRVRIRLGLEGLLRIYHGEVLVASHALRDQAEGWGTLAEHRSEMWQSTLQVEQRPLAVYEEVGVMETIELPQGQLENLLDKLKLDHLEGQLDAVCEQAAQHQLDYKNFLAQALQTEWQGRFQRGIEARLKLARFPWLKTLDQFEFDFQPSVDRRLVRELAGMSFVERAHNVVLLGPPGVGKTHIAIGLGIKAVEAGYSVLFLTLEQLMTRLVKAFNENRLERTLQQLTYPKVLIIDEIGYLPLSNTEASLFFRLVTRRYERASLIITSNKSFLDWGEVFNDPVLATAVLDRLLHYSTTLNIKGESYRLKDKRKAGLLGRPNLKEEMEVTTPA